MSDETPQRDLEDAGDATRRTMADVLEAAPLMARGIGRPSPYELGWTARITGQAGPSEEPSAKASWADRLFWRGWRDAGDLIPKRGIMRK